MRRNLVQEVMSEQCIYGGLLATRAEVYSDLMRLAKHRGENPDQNFIDRLTWMPPKATPEMAAHLAHCGMTLAAIRKAEQAGLL